MSHYAMCLLVWCVCVRWIFNICHCIHAFALIVLQSTTSILRMYRVHSYCIDASCTIAYWVERENTCDAFFFHSASFGINQCQFYNDYFHFNFHAKRFFSFKCSLHPCIYCLLYLVIALESLVDHHHNKITCHTFYDFISRVFQFSPFWILHRYDKT